MKVTEVTEADFETVVGESHLPVLVDFYTHWCRPCKALAPAVEELAAEYSGRLKVVKVDTDANERLAKRFKIESIPTLLLLHPGAREGFRLVGLNPKSDLKKWLDDYIDKVVLR